MRRLTDLRARSPKVPLQRLLHVRYLRCPALPCVRASLLMISHIFCRPARTLAAWFRPVCQTNCVFLGERRCVHYRVKHRCSECMAAEGLSTDKVAEATRKMPRGQGWNAKRLRDDGMAIGADGVPGSGATSGIVVHGVVPQATAKKSSGGAGGVKKNGAKLMLQPGAGVPVEGENDIPRFTFVILPGGSST